MHGRGRVSSNGLGSLKVLLARGIGPRRIEKEMVAQATLSAEDEEEVAIERLLWTNNEIK